MIFPHPMPVASNVLLSDNLELLLALRADSALWETPGGKLNANETIAEAAERELLEETGIIGWGTPAHLGFTESITYHKRRIICHFVFRATWSSFPQRIEPDKCMGYEWFPINKLPPREQCTSSTGEFIYSQMFVEACLRRIQQKRIRAFRTPDGPRAA